MLFCLQYLQKTAVSGLLRAVGFSLKVSTWLQEKKTCRATYILHKSCIDQSIGLQQKQQLICIHTRFHKHTNIA